MNAQIFTNGFGLIYHRGAREVSPARTRWPLFSRAMRVVMAFLVVPIFLLSIPVRWEELSHPYPAVRAGLETLGISTGFYAGFIISMEMMVALVYWTLALVLFRRRSNERTGIYCAHLWLLFGVASYPLLRTTEALAVAHPEWELAVHTLNYFAWVGVYIFFCFFCIFPNGRMSPAWGKWVISRLWGRAQACSR